MDQTENSTVDQLAPAAVASHYDALDRFYREIWGEHVHHGLWTRGDESAHEAVEALVHLVAKAANLQAGEGLLDVGCGYGGTVRMLSRAYGVHAEGITLSSRQYEYAMATAAGEGKSHDVRYHHGNWLESNLPANSFDVVVAIESMTHMPSLKDALARIYKVLRPGGRFVACVWLAGPNAGAGARRWLLQPICKEGRLAGLPTATSLNALLDEVGFVAAAPMQDLSRKVRRTWTLTIQRGFKRLFTDSQLRAFLLNPQQTERVFAAAMIRIWIALHTGSMQYGLFSVTKPPLGQGVS